MGQEAGSLVMGGQERFDLTSQREIIGANLGQNLGSRRRIAGQNLLEHIANLPPTVRRQCAPPLSCCLRYALATVQWRFTTADETPSSVAASSIGKAAEEAQLDDLGGFGVELRQ
jgi:hypothetical protein